MAANEIHVASVGLGFVITVEKSAGEPEDLSASTSRQFVFEKPDGTLLTAPASLVSGGTDGVVSYTFAEGDLDQAGTWRYQVVVEFGATRLYSDVGKFKVYPNLPL